jgi:hypothetical protein
MFSSWFRSFGLAALVVCLVIPAGSQQTISPTITFSFDFPGSAPDHYVISVSSDGSASYDSDGKISPQAETGDLYHSEFKLSETARSHVFDLAKRAHYFDAELDSKNKKIAFTGTKTLTYKDGQKNTKASYNYSPVGAVQDLTSFFQALSNTLEFGHRLEYYLRYQKLALDDELKRMDEMVNSGNVAEVYVVTPVLEKIVADPAVMKVVRVRAQRLLQLAGSTK